MKTNLFSQKFTFFNAERTNIYINMAKAYYMNERRMVQQWDIRGSTSSSVIVRNLSPATTEETIIIHFQKRKNGGGEVEGVRLLSEGVAVVTFETSQGWWNLTIPVTYVSICWIKFIERAGHSCVM